MERSLFGYLKFVLAFLLGKNFFIEAVDREQGAWLSVLGLPTPEKDLCLDILLGPLVPMSFPKFLNTVGYYS